jgi:Flp pilus assembly protein TadG
VLSRRDEGSLTLLIIGYTLIAAVLIVVGIDVSKVFLAQRALSSAADAAALAGAQAVDRGAIYADGAVCADLPVDPAAAQDAADASVRDTGESLRPTFVSLADPDVRVQTGRVQVGLRGEVSVPFGRVLAMLLPDHPEGRVDVSAASTAASVLAAPTC